MTPQCIHLKLFIQQPTALRSSNVNGYQLLFEITYDMKQNHRLYYS